jgi:hypothetical protein
MYKALCVAILLLATLAFTSGSKPADASPVSPATPFIVARVGLFNQTTAIPTTTIFTPQVSGLYRVSPYLSVTSASSAGNWNFTFGWTDDGGVPEYSIDMLNAAGYAGTWGSGYAQAAGSFTFRAIKGQPVSYSTTGAGGDYELLLTIEKL